MALFISIIGFLFAIFLIITFHEFGHFISAKASGVRVDEFAFGFPPNIWRKKIGETTYAINIVLLGGFVKLYGEDGKDAEDPRSFASRPLYIKLLIFAAGVFMNFVLAYFIIFGSYLAGTQPIIPGMADQKGVNNNMHAIVMTVEKGTPAAKEGLQKGDIIEKVDGIKVNDSTTIVQHLEEKAAKNKNVIVNAEISRNGQIFVKTFSTYLFKENVGGKTREVPRIGVVLETTGKVSAPFFTAIKASFIEVGTFIYEYTTMFFQVIGGAIIHFKVPEGLAGPIGVYILTSNAAQSGFSIFIQWVAILSIAVGIINILPVPGLDGGQILVTLIESAARKKFTAKTKGIIQFAGLGFVVILYVALTFKDFFTFGIIK